MLSVHALCILLRALITGACAGFNLTGTNTGAVIAGSVWAGGLATLVEKKSRRMELAQYCAARALEAFIRCCSLWARRRRAGGGAVHGLGGGRPRLPPRPPTAALRATPPRPSALRRAAEAAAAAAGGHGGWLGLVVGLLRRADVLMFSLGCGAIMHCYSDGCGADRDVFRSKYLNVLDFIFGNQGEEGVHGFDCRHGCGGWGYPDRATGGMRDAAPLLSVWFCMAKGTGGRGRARGRAKASAAKIRFALKFFHLKRSCVSLVTRLPGVDEGAISHVPSNYQLVSTVGRHIRSMSRGVLSPSDSHAQCPSPLPRSAEPSAADMHSMRGRGSSYGSNLPYSSTVTAAAAAVGGGGHVRDSSGYMGAGQSQGQRRQSLQGEHGHGLYGRSSQHVSAGHSTNVYGSSGTHQQSHTYHSHHHHSEAGGSSYAHGSSPHSPVVQNGYPVQRLGGSSMGSALYGEEAAAHHGSHIRSAVSGPGCASTDCGRLPTSEADPAEGRQHHNHPLSAISIAAAAAAAGGVRQGPPSAASPGSSQPVSPIHGLLGHELVTGSGTAAWAGGQGMSSRSRSPSPQAPIAAAAAAVAPAAHTGPARSSGSSEDSGWEDVWAAATSGSPPERPGSRPVRHTAAVRQSKNLGEQVDAEAESAPASSSGLGAWAAQLVARALGGGGGGSKGGSWSRLAGWSTSQTGGGGGGGEPQPKTRGSGMLGRSSSSIRRTNTAPSLPTDALLLLSDPASEGRGHGRSSYQQLQLLADGGANGCGSGPGTPTHGSRSLSSSLGALGGGGGGGSASSGYLSASFCGGGAGRSMTVSSGGGGGGGESKLPPPAFRSRLVPPSLPQPIRRAPQGQSDAFYKVPLGGGRASHGNLIAAAGSAGGGGGASASVGSRLDSLAAATSWAAPQRPTAAGAAVYGSRTTASRAVAAAAAPVAATATSSSAPAQPRLLADSLPSFSCHVRPGALARAAASRDGGSDAGNERMEEEVKDREGRRHARAVLASVRSFTTTGLPIQVEAQTSQDRHQQQQKQQKQQGDGDGGTLAHLDMPSLRGFFHTHTSPVQQGAQPSWPRISLDWPAAAGGPGALRAALLANGEQVRGQQEGAETAGGVDEAAGMPTGLGSPTQVAGEVTVHDGVAAAVRGLAVQEEGDVEAVAQEVGEDEVEDRADGQGEAAGAGVSVGAAAVRPEAAAVVVKEGGNGGSAPQRVVQQGQGNGTGAGHGHGHRKKGKGKKGRK